MSQITPAADVFEGTVVKCVADKVPAHASGGTWQQFLTTFVRSPYFPDRPHKDGPAFIPAILGTTRNDNGPCATMATCSP
jgi:hypothetical protein